MAHKEWFRVNEAYQLLGFPSPRSLRYWITKGRSENWLKVGVHIKPLIPSAERVTWQLHLDRCKEIGVKS